MEDQVYDVVICGTGLKECILSGLLSTNGRKVLHLDRHNYYGGDTASLTLTKLYEKAQKSEIPTQWGPARDWNVDLIPKFIMAHGKLTQLLTKTKVHKYLQFKVVDGTYVYQYQKGNWLTPEKYIHKVPASEKEALLSSLIPYSEKIRGRSFFSFIANWDSKDSKTWNRFIPETTTMDEVYKFFGLQSNTIDFIGHAIALYTTDEYLHEPMGNTMGRLRLYMDSLVRYGTSPFIYPMYGLGTLPEGFSRLSAVYGGTYMLNKPIAEFEYDDSGKVCGVRSTDGELAKCKMVICDPSYVANTTKIKHVGKVIRYILFLDHPIPNTEGRKSCQIILPQKQLDRKHDIYIAMVSYTHGVASKDYYIALISTTVETDDPWKEIEPAVALVGPYLDHIPFISDLYEATDDGKLDKVYVTNSYDATSHFESATEDVLRIWKNITGISE